MRSIAMAVAALLLVACGTTHSVDAGADGGDRRDAAAHDAGHERDAAMSDAAGSDAGASDAGEGVDAGQGSDAGGEDGSDGGSADCNPDAVRFLYLAGGPLQVGTYCDDVFACAASPAEANRIESASPDFDCGDTPEGPCEGRTCTYDPSTIDEAELAEICAVTLVTPTPDIACVVYGP